MIKLIAVVLSAMLVACGGGGDDAEVPGFDVPLSAQEVDALAAQCAGHGRLVSSDRIRWIITIDGVRYHQYARGVCRDGTVVKLTVSSPGF